MAHILAIEAATEACSVALLRDGELLERYELAPRRHALLILPFADALLQETGMKLSSIDAVAFGRGPGSFTGLRIAAGVAQGIAFGAGVPVVPVSTLAALAQGALTDDSDGVLAALDARMQEVYWGVYRRGVNGLVELSGEEKVCRPEQVPAPQGGNWLGAGSGWDRYRDTLMAASGLPARRVREGLMPRAVDIARLAEVLFYQGFAFPPQQAIPVYLRNNVATKPGSGDRNA